MSFSKNNQEENIDRFIKDNSSNVSTDIQEKIEDETDYVVDYPVLFYADCLDVE